MGFIKLCFNPKFVSETLSPHTRTRSVDSICCVVSVVRGLRSWCKTSHLGPCAVQSEQNGECVCVIL